MRELSLNILDICKNSTKAGATIIKITIDVQEKDDILNILIDE